MRFRGVVRVGLDRSSSHKDPNYEVPPGAFWEGSLAKQGASRTYANGQPIMRLGDSYHPHIGWKHIIDPTTGNVIQVPDEHSNVVAAEGSETVMVENKPIHLRKYKVGCGNTWRDSVAVTGSKDVLVGE